jgi:hypothetical protein
MAFGSPQWMYKSGEAYEIDQSLRFNDDDSAYLSKTFASAGNRKTWTWSGWVKRGSLDDTAGQLVMFGAGTAATNFTMFYITKSTAGDPDCLLLYDYNAPTDYGWRSEIVLRDPSAWYHIMCVMDTTISTPAVDRVKFYVNGVRQSDIGTDYGNLAEDYESHINNNIEHNIGKYPSNAQYYDGYLAEVHFIDGTALTPTSFGETGTYGEWKPIEVTDLTYGTNGFYLSFAGGGIIAATGGDSVTTDGDYKVHSFTSTGNSTFTVTSIPETEAIVEYLVIAGGAGGTGGGGGAGGYRTGVLTVTDQAYTVTVGAGGPCNPTSGIGSSGDDSVFSTITSTGGGKAQTDGGSGGGGDSNGDNGGAGNTPSTTPSQGNDGGDCTSNGASGGGGGAGEAGAHGAAGGTGGDGLYSSITGTAVIRAGGGGGGGSGRTAAGGAGGGGTGKDYTDSSAEATPNTGSGGGGGYNRSGDGDGGSGIVIIRYKFQ